MNLALADITAIHAWKLPAFLRNPGRSQATRAKVVEQPFQRMGKGSTVSVANGRHRYERREMPA